MTLRRKEKNGLPPEDCALHPRAPPAWLALGALRNGDELTNDDDLRFICIRGTVG